MLPDGWHSVLAVATLAALGTLAVNTLLVVILYRLGPDTVAGVVDDDPSDAGGEVDADAGTLTSSQD